MRWQSNVQRVCLWRGRRRQKEEEDGSQQQVVERIQPTLFRWLFVPLHHCRLDGKSLATANASYASRAEQQSTNDSP